jgi:zinc protease
MKAIVSLILGFILSTAPAEAAKIPKADYQLKLDNYSIQLQSYPFPSGLHVIFQEEHSQPVVAVTSVIDSGAENDQPGMEGIAHVIEHLAFRAQHGDLPKNMDLIKQLGGSFNASTWTDWTNYMTIAPRDALEPLLAVEARRLKEALANVTEKDVKLEVEIARNEKRMRDENGALGDAFRVAGQLLYPEGHPYTRSVIGSHDSLSAITLAAANEYVAKHYVPENTTIVVVGDFKLSEGFGLLMKAWEQDLDLLMSPTDAAKFNALTSQAERNTFLDKWVATLGEYIQTHAGQGAKKRVDCSKREDPPMPVSQEALRIKGQVKKETTVLVWSTPGGYCGDDTIANIAANQLTNNIYRTIVPSWEWSNDEQSVDGIGCFYNPSEYAGAVYCFIEPAEGYKGTRLADKAADALYLQWDREVYKSEMYRGFIDWSFSTAKINGMTSILNSVDEVASLSGRATATAMDAHFTGDVRYFSRMMNQIDGVSGMFPVQEYARKWLTRDRMVTIIVEPMDEEERERMEAAARSGEGGGDAGYAGASRDDALSTLFSMEDMKGDKLAAQVISPDRAKGREFKMDNGMNVIILPHGDAPLIRAELFLGGNADSAVSAEGLDSFTHALHRRGTRIPGSESMLSIAGYYQEGGSGYGRVLAGGGASGNLDAVLSRIRKETGEVDYRMAAKREWIKDRVKSSKGPKYSGDPDTWASRLRSEHLYGDHPYGNWGNRAYWERMREWDQGHVEGWLNRKYQPANATLIVVGKVPDLDAAEASVRAYFDSWAAKPGTEVGPLAPPEAPTHRSQRRVVVFDKPTATQTDITLACPMESWTNENYLAGKVLGDSVSEIAWRRLREKAGVTYGAYAYNSTRPGGASALMVGGLFQNNAAEFAISTYLDLVEKASTGDIDPSIVATAKWSKGRETVLAQQSSNQMANYLVGAVSSGKGLDYLSSIATNLSSVDIDQMSALVAPCKGHEIFTIIGPLQYASDALESLGLTYEVVDWDDLHQAQLDENELKKHLKKKKKWLEKQAEEKAEEADSKADPKAGSSKDSAETGIQMTGVAEFDDLFKKVKSIQDRIVALRVKLADGRAAIAAALGATAGTDLSVLADQAKGGVMSAVSVSMAGGVPSFTVKPDAPPEAQQVAAGLTNLANTAKEATQEMAKLKDDVVQLINDAQAFPGKAPSAAKDALKSGSLKFKDIPKVPKKVAGNIKEMATLPEEIGGLAKDAASTAAVLGSLVGG